MGVALLRSEAAKFSRGQADRPEPLSLGLVVGRRRRGRRWSRTGLAEWLGFIALGQRGQGEELLLRVGALAALHRAEIEIPLARLVRRHNRSLDRVRGCFDSGSAVHAQ